MLDMVQCPLCGTMNAPTQKVCMKCQTPLSGEAFQPGQAPVRKDTGELEPILPEWLREARETAKQSGLSERYQKPETTQPASPGADLLAGLQSQAKVDEEEDVPDWLANITGTGGSKSKPKPEEPAEMSGVRWVETGHKGDFQQEEEMPPWLAGMQSAQASSDEKDELTGWLRDSDARQEAFSAPPQQTPAFDLPFSAQPEQTNQFDTPSPAPEETPDWLKQMAAEAGEMKSEPQADSAFNDESDWFDRLSATESNAGVQEPTPEPFSPSADTPDWLKQMSAQADSAVQMPASEPAAQNAETPDWLRDLGGTSSGESTPFVESTPAKSEPFASDADLPSGPGSEKPKKTDSTPVWLQERGEAQAAAPPWLASDEPAEVESSAAPQDDAFGGLPDWLKSAAPDSSLFDEPAQAQDVPSAAPPPVRPAFESTPAFADNAMPATGSDALFTEMPDWLSSAETPSVSAASEPTTGSDALTPDVLPSWVEAMRPVQGLAGVSSSDDQTLESRGALAGLQGVLPAGTGFTPTSKPKTYSNKLNVSDEQLKHAEIFEQILAAETAPEILVSEKTLPASRGLRWALAGILLGVVFIAYFLNAQIFSAPLGVPNELSYAVAVAQAIPENAPVLVAVDYEASRAGEMEAAAAPLFDNLILLKHPRLTFVASNETGSILAERFISGPLAFHNYQSGVTYLNLGYLSGGQVGIRAFAQNPPLAAPMDISSQPAWNLPPLQGVSALNQFALIILLTDDADAARFWVEQTQSPRGATPIVAIASAQATPMIQPYYESGQLAGIISGLYGGAIVERQYNNGRPGLARSYWDSYSLGMLLAMMIVVVGGFINLGIGMRDRTATRKGEIA